MSKRGEIEFLSDIREAIRRITAYVKNLDYEKFLQDLKTQDAVVRNLEIIGGSAKNISNEIKKKNPEIPWKELAAVRDRLIHHYFGVNYDIVWAIVKKELPDVVGEIEEMIKNHKQKNGGY